MIFSVNCILLGCRSSNTSVSENDNLIINKGLDEQEKANMTEILFENLFYNFGEVIQGETVSYTFHYKNVGNAFLIISNIETSCGCTRTIPSREPIKPGEKGKITITVDSEDKKIGEMTSYVVVTANTYPAQTMLTLHASIVSIK